MYGHCFHQKLFREAHLTAYIMFTSQGKEDVCQNIIDWVNIMNIYFYSVMNEMLRNDL